MKDAVLVPVGNQMTLVRADPLFQSWEMTNATVRSTFTTVTKVGMLVNTFACGCSSEEGYLNLIP